MSDPRATVPTCACCEEPFTVGFVRLWPDTNIRVCYDCIDWMTSQRDLQIARSGGAVRVLGHEPIFRVRDLAQAAAHYQLLGFKTRFYDETYAFADFGNLTLHLTRSDDPSEHTTSALYIHVEDADRVAADWRAAGLAVDGPQNEDYGKREGQHVDLDGNLIRFGSPIRN
jgi:uncharacterized glyoxalase superfamily protein PhnB